MGLATLFQRAAYENWRKTAVVSGRARISYHCLEVRSTQVAGMLRDILGGRQKKVLLLAHNSIFCLEVFLGCFQAGMVVCPVNWRLSPYEMATLLIQEQFDLIFHDQATSALLQQALEICDLQIPQMRLGGIKYESHIKFFAYDRPAIGEDQTAEEIAIQYFTSGSTGVPKGVLLSHRSLMGYVQTYTRASGWTRDTVYQTTANLFHLSGFSALISLMLGNTLVLMDHFHLEVFLSAMEKEGVTRVSMVPTLFTTMLGNDRDCGRAFCNVKRLVYAGSAMAPAQIEAALKRLPCGLEMAYGSTETCCISLLTEDDHRAVAAETLGTEKLSSVGRPLPGVSVRVADDQVNALPAGEVGELLVKSPFLYQGYSNVHAHRSLTDDGYHHTGDIGYQDADGFLYILDRKHDMIICGGENIYPREVELCISKMVNFVQAVSVVGKPDPVWGEIVVAFVIPKPGVRVEAEDIVAFCKHNIASYKKPRNVVFVEELPLDGNGKVSKKALRTSLETERMFGQ